MRRWFGCLFTLLLVTLILVVLVARGPGLGTLPIPGKLQSLVGEIVGTVEGGAGPATQPPVPAVVTPVAQRPTAVERLATATAIPPAVTPEPGEIVLALDIRGPAGEPLAAVIDGNAVALTAQVTNSTSTQVAGKVSFSLGPSDAEAIPLGSCYIEAGPGQQTACSVRVAADGWAWQDHPPSGAGTPEPVESRTVYATLDGTELSAMSQVSVRPKPVVLVHGFTSSAAAWSAWNGPAGFLAGWGIAGFAVGDGSFDIEPMNTGDFAQPRRPTNSIAENAAIVARYVDAVRQATGAERVDLVAHSMGGLIARHYISHFMPMVERQDLPAVPAVNQLYMIGTPNAGTTCAIPPATLGLYPPATTQLTPSYIQYLFNPRTSDPRGVPFFVLAGDPVHDFAALVCTPVPTDVFVSVTSAAGAIPVVAERMPVRHGEQTQSPDVFATVLRSLARGPRDYPIPLPTAPAVAPMDTGGLQISLVDSGTLPADGPTTVSVTVDAAEGVSFLLYAPGQDVEMSILSSAGQQITTETAKSAEDVSAATIDGRGITATQGFKIDKPGAGRWQLVLTPRAGSESGGAFYAVAAFLQSDLRLSVETPAPVVPASQLVPIRAVLSGPVSIETAAVIATVRNARGEVVGEVTLFNDGAHGDAEAGDGVFGGAWTPAQAGLYTVVVTASGQNVAGTAFQRLAVLAVEVQGAE